MQPAIVDRDARVSNRKAEAPDRRERRRRAMIAAACDLFLDRGFDAVSLQEIVRRSGGSLSTLYALFENKAGLLGAILADSRFEGHARIAALIERGGPPRQLLREIAGILHDHFTDARTVGLLRLVSGVALRDPAVSRVIYEVAHRPTLDLLTGLFVRWIGDHSSRITDPRVAAEFFLALVIHPAQSRALFRYSDQRDEAAVETMLDQAIEVFVEGYGVGP